MGPASSAAIDSAHAVARRWEWFHAPVLQQPYAAAIIELTVPHGRWHGPAVPAAVGDEPAAPVAGVVQAGRHPQHLQPATVAAVQ